MNVHQSLVSLSAALTVRPNCWNVLIPQCDVLVAVEDKLFVLDQYEAILQVRMLFMMKYNISVFACSIFHLQNMEQCAFSLIPTDDFDISYAFFLVLGSVLQQQLALEYILCTTGHWYYTY